MFTTNYKVMISDINYGGHMGNERALSIFQQTRIEWLSSLGYSELNIGEDIGIIQTESHVYYLKEVSFGENLKSVIKDINISRAAIEFFFEVINEEKEIVLKGSVKNFSYNYSKKKLVSLPKEFKERASNFLEKNKS